MQLVAIGLDHEGAPVEVRERVAIPASRFKEAMERLSEYVSHGLILSTCNRTEVYALEEAPRNVPEDVKRFFCDYSGVEPGDLLPRLLEERQQEAARHLFRVASGLESLIVGEYEVLGQVRHVIVEAEGLGDVDLLLLNLFREAVRVGRRVRHETGVSKNAASVSSAAVEVARKVFPSLADRSVLVIGAGQAGMVTVKALVNSAVSRVVVMSRSLEHASELAASLGGVAAPFHELKQALVDTDIVICCSGSPHFVLGPETVGEATKGRKGGPLLLIDIAVPRDVDPSVKAIGDVLLYDIDDLEGVAKTNRQLRESEVFKASSIVDEEVERFMAWWQSRHATPAITALMDRAEAIRVEQLEKALKALPGLSEQQRACVEAMTKSVVQRILHGPLTYLKSNGDGAQVVRDLFGLDVPR